MKPSHLLSSLFFVLVFSATHAQTPVYTQGLATPTYLFPELTGWHGGMQVNAAGRTYYGGYMNNAMLSTDAYIHKLRSGVGVSANHQRFGAGIATTNSVDMKLAPKIKLGDHHTLMPAVSVQMGQIHYGPSFIAGSKLPVVSDNANYISLGAGVALMSGQTFFAAHSDNLNQPNASIFANSENRIPRSYQFLAGHNFKAGAWAITPSVFYMYQGGFNIKGLSANAQFKGFYVGGRVMDGYTWAGAVGYEFNQRVRISYSYDKTFSRLGIGNVNGHELTIRLWLFKDKAKRQFISNLPLL